jgi:hypothetical protein
VARAAKLRLRQALEDVIAENKGDHPRGHARGTDAELVNEAQKLLGRLGGDDRSADSPGRRAAEGNTPGRAFDSASQRARELLSTQGATRAGAEDGGR